MRPFKNVRLLIALSCFVPVFCSCKKETPRKPNSVYILSLDPASPASLQFGDFVVILTDYYITQDGGARYWIEPYTNGDISPGVFILPQRSIPDREKGK